jgi:hypothetical protein
MLSSEFSGSGLKDRVAACRKRLRVSRGTHRLQANDDGEELFPETAPSVTDFQNYVAGNLPECPAISTSAVRVDYRFPFAGAEAGDREVMLLAEQEVGIT